MRKYFFTLIAVLIGQSAVLPGNAFAGIGGAGNTADLSIQLEFVKATGIQILKFVNPKDIPLSPSYQKAIELYSSCRQTMLIGALKTRFSLVESIRDGGKYHALARRSSDEEIQISRSEMNRLIKAGLYGPTLLISLFVHEVGHDCVYDGKKVDDSFDGVLNEIGGLLMMTYNAQSLTSYIDVDFISRTKESQNQVVFQELSNYVRKRIAKKFMDYLGDWIYIQNRGIFADRPAPASEFYAGPKTGFFNGWGALNFSKVQPPAAVTSAVNNILKASFETNSLSYFNGSKNTPLTHEMTCSYVDDAGNGLGGSSCRLFVYWPTLFSDGLAAKGIQIDFEVDMASDIKFNRLRMLN